LTKKGIQRLIGWASRPEGIVHEIVCYMAGVRDGWRSDADGTRISSIVSAFRTITCQIANDILCLCSTTLSFSIHVECTGGMTRCPWPRARTSLVTRRSTRRIVQGRAIEMPLCSFAEIRALCTFLSNKEKKVASAGEQTHNTYYITARCPLRIYSSTRNMQRHASRPECNPTALLQRATVKVTS
jgi:hypothetical protein